MNYEGYYVTFNKMYGMCGMYMEGHIKDIYQFPFWLEQGFSHCEMGLQSLPHFPSKPSCRVVT